MNATSWSAAQRAALQLCRRSKLPMLLALGPDHVLFPNDACIALLGPQLSQARLRERLLPLLRAVSESGEAQEPQDIELERSAIAHCVPLRADDATPVEGVFCVLLGSVAHEITQPLAAASANASACLRWLAADPPDLAEAAAAARNIVRDTARAGEIIRRIRQIRAAKPLPGGD